VDSAGLVILLGALAILLSRRVPIGIGALVAQGVSIGVLDWVPSLQRHPELWVFLGATWVVKAGLVPALIWRGFSVWPDAHYRDPALPLWAYAGGLFLWAVVYHVVRVLDTTGLVSSPVLVTEGLATVFVGLFTVGARRHFLSQVMSLMVVENGLVLLARALAGSLPAILEWGLLIDVGLLGVVALWINRRLHHLFRTADTGVLKRLRG